MPSPETAKPSAPNAPTSGGISETPVSRSSSSPMPSGGTATTAAGRAQTAAIRPLTPRLIEILEARALDVELLAKHGVGASSRLSGDCIAIPYFENGIRVNTKYRLIGEAKGFTQDEGARKVFWNVDCLRDETLANSPLIITEGEFDALAAIMAGYPRTVSVPDGAPAQKIEGESRKYTYLDEAETLLRDCRDIILAVDGDGPGANLLHDLSIRLGKHRCKWVRYPLKAKGSTDRLKDLNEVLQAYGVEGVQRTLQQAQWCKVAGVYRMSDLPPVPLVPALDIGMVNLWEHYRMRPGDFCVVTGIPGHGKALALDTPIATPAGWTTMGRIQVGDDVFDERGQPCRVVAATPVMIGRPCFRLKFSGGAEIVADAEHQWFTVPEPARRSIAMARNKRAGREETKLRGTDQRHKMTLPGLVTTAQIAASLKSQGKWNHQIDNAGPLDLPPVALPIPPYALGAWLGDGTSSGGGLTCFDNEILLAVGAENLTVRAQATAGRYTIRHIVPKLRQLGILDDKHIPAAYLRASKDQRMALLRGLMDTDGHCAKDGVCEFTNTNLALATGFLELASSLGLRANWMEHRATLKGRDCGPKYRIQFSAPFPVFTVGRKLERQRAAFGHRKRTSYRTIVGCESMPSVPVRCIQVDSPSHLYLAGRAMIPTHNSSVINEFCGRMALGHGWSTVFASFEQRPQTDHRRALRTFFNSKRAIHQSAREIAAADDWIERYFSFIVPDEDDEADLVWILERAAAAIVQHGAKIVVIDPFNEIDHVRPPDMSLTEYTGFAIKQFRRLAKKYQVHVIVAAHPAKMKKRDDGSYGIPTLYDISDSAHWYNKADIGIVIHRTGEKPQDFKTLIRISKSKYHDEIGKPGDLEAHFDPEQNRYVVIDNTDGSTEAA